MKRIALLVILFTLSGYSQIAQSDLQVLCFERELEIAISPDPVLLKICTFKNHLFKTQGIADNKGRYSYNYELFKISETDTLAVENSSLFNEHADELKEKLNRVLRAEYDSNSKEPELKECMSSIDFRTYKLNEFGISFNENSEMIFNIDYNIGSACMNVGGSQVALKLAEIEPYLN